MSREQVIDVARLRELLAQATPGPWQSMNEYQWDTIIGDIDGPDDGDMHYELVSDITSNHDRSRANARLIVAAVNALPELLNAYDRLSMPAADVETGQRWRDDDSDAEVLAVVKCNKVRYAVMQRIFMSGKRANKPFLFAAKSMLKGDDGWRILPTAGSEGG